MYTVHIILDAVNRLTALNVVNVCLRFHSLYLYIIFIIFHIYFAFMSVPLASFDCS